MYGFQWRHFGAKYVDCETDYSGKRFDQLMYCIHNMKNDPTSRRIVMSAWNPCDLDTMVLPPCHMFCQFHVGDGKLSCQMYQRSADMGLGVPFNVVASYSLLTHMVAHCCDLEAGEFIHVVGGAHVHKNPVDSLKEQFQRSLFGFPTIKLNSDIKNIDEFKFFDVELVGYKCHPSIKMELSA